MRLRNKVDTTLSLTQCSTQTVIINAQIIIACRGSFANNKYANKEEDR